MCVVLFPILFFLFFFWNDTGKGRDQLFFCVVLLFYYSEMWVSRGEAEREELGKQEKSEQGNMLNLSSVYVGRRRKAVLNYYCFYYSIFTRGVAHKRITTVNV